jgi:ribosome biogenesis GTPase
LLNKWHDDEYGMVMNMDLTALGYDRWVEEQVGNLLQTEPSIARVTAVDRGAFLIRNQHGETIAELPGKFRFSARSAIDLPCVGDWVCVQKPTTGGPAIIQAVLPRRTFLRRKCAGRTVEYQMIAANLDIACIVQSCQDDFNLRRLDRYLVMAREGRIQPWIILSKSDLIAPEDLRQRIEEIKSSGMSSEVLALSNATGAGIEDFRRMLVPGKTYCLLGSSGVGKTTLINRLIGQDAFETNDVSGTGRGVHTTSRRHLLILDHGALLIDTPGMRELGLLGTGDGMDENFAQIQALALNCRYSNCNHILEPGCAVRSSLEKGELSEARYQSFLKLKRESEYQDLTYVKKRKKDRNFGRFVKKTLKHIKEDEQ